MLIELNLLRCKPQSSVAAGASIGFVSAAGGEYMLEMSPGLELPSEVPHGSGTKRPVWLGLGWSRLILTLRPSPMTVD